MPLPSPTTQIHSLHATPRNPAHTRGGCVRLAWTCSRHGSCVEPCICTGVSVVSRSIRWLVGYQSWRQFGVALHLCLGAMKRYGGTNEHGKPVRPPPVLP